ncbi:MAG: CapA family protein [Clostridia bacterium]|nr:CapA family protein [Clostridia bacterium]
MKIAIGGDLCVMEDCYSLFANGDSRAAFGNVGDILSRSDYSIINLECAITESDNAIKKFGPNLKAPFGTGLTLKNAGVTHTALSNNHIFDFGTEGITDTLRELEKNGIVHTGFGENREDARRDLIITDGKIKVAVIAVCEHEYSYALDNRMGAREYDPYDTVDDIAEAKKKADYVVVLYHGGKEYCPFPSERLYKLCHSMVRHGADVVLCQHSHCIGCYERYLGGHILYGQGNFHFICSKWSGEDEDGGKSWNTGLLVSLELDKECKLKLIPILAEKQGIRLANEEESREILKEIEDRSLSLNNGEYKKRFAEFCKTVEGVYGFIPDSLKDLFSHYLDCEAHTDVWRELYKTWNHTNEL